MKYIVIILALTFAVYAKTMNKNIDTEAIFTYLNGCDKYCEYDIVLTKKANRSNICKVYILSSYKQPLLNKKYNIDIQDGKVIIVNDNNTILEAKLDCNKKSKQ